MTPGAPGGDSLGAVQRTGDGCAREKESKEGSGQRPPQIGGRRSYGTRTCPACGEPFRATHPNQVYCPPTDEDRERWKGQARSRCANKAANAAYRGTELVVAKVGQPFDCAGCGKSCVPGENVAPHATKFCGRRCKAAWHKERERDRLEALTGARG
jgi:hypothetical protein